MGKRKLKKQYEKYNIDVVDILSKFDPSGTNKLTPFLLKEFAKNFTDAYGRLSNTITQKSHWALDYIDIQNNWQESIVSYIIDTIGGRDKIELLEKFYDHLENNRIEKSDINEYKNWREISSSVAKADMKIFNKEMSKQVKVVYQDDTWLAIKPLSFKASQTYGYQTKWCTAMKHEPSYFYRYSKNGILVYVINKQTGRKFGFYSSPDEFSVWDTKDKRIDSLETRLPLDILSVVRESLDLDTNLVNHEYFSEEELEEKYRLLGKPEKKMADLANDDELVVYRDLNPENDQNPEMGAMEEINEMLDGLEEGGDSDEEEEEESYDEAEDMSMEEEIYEAETEDMGMVMMQKTLDENSDDNWEARGADVAFGIGADMPQTAQIMEIQANEVMEAPENVYLDVVDEDYDMDVEGNDAG